MIIPPTRFTELERASAGFQNATGEDIATFAPGINSPFTYSAEEFDPELGNFADSMDAIARNENFDNAEHMLASFEEGVSSFLASHEADQFDGDSYDSKGETVGGDANVKRVVLNLTRTAPPGTLPVTVDFWGSLINTGTINPANGSRVFDPGGPNELVMQSAVIGTTCNFLEQIIFSAPARIKRVRLQVDKVDQFANPWSLIRLDIDGNSQTRPLPIAQQVDPYQFQANLLDVPIDQVFDNATKLSTQVSATTNFVSYTFDIIQQASLRDIAKNAGASWKSPSVTAKKAAVGVQKAKTEAKKRGINLPLQEALRRGRSVQKLRTGLKGGFRNIGR